MIVKLLRASIRLLLLMATLSTVAAIVLGRANPGSPPRRVASLPSYQVLDQAITARHGRATVVVHLDSGQLQTLALPPDMGIDKASLSPWEEDGRRQIVGVGWNRSGAEGSLSRTDFGFVRMSLPDGEVLDRLILSEEALPWDAPCWVPGAPASVLYVGSDDRLYRVDFKSSLLGPNALEAVDRHPRPLEWQVSFPRASGVQFRDLTWPDEPRLGGRALVSLRFKDRETGRYTDWQIWWMQLDWNGTSVVALGQLLAPGSSDTAVSLRLPNLVSVYGEPALAYLARRPGEPGWQLRVAPIHFDPDSGSPQAHDVDSRLLAENCLPSSPVASPDGRWITVVRTSGPQLRTERIAIPGDAEPDLTGSIGALVFWPEARSKPYATGAEIDSRLQKIKSVMAGSPPAARTSDAIWPRW
jgi:hypothetical protein